MNRRQFLQSLAVGTAAVNMGALGRALAQAPAGAFLPLFEGRSRAAHAVARLTFGVTPALYEQVRALGADAFVQQQLAPEALDDSALDAMLEPLRPILNENGGILAQQYGDDRRRVTVPLILSAVLRGIYSQRQLYERMVEFCGDHLHVFIQKGPVLFLKIDDDRDVVRPHSFAQFRTLLGASAHSPAMLVYLDNAQSERSHPNENYARELLELHTLGVNGGYTEDDVKEVARCFTGWSVQREREGSGATAFRFRRGFHDDGSKTVLGVTIAPNGEQEGEQVLDLLASHPSTARFLSTKLVRRFVSDVPPDVLVNACVDTYAATSGNLRAMLTALFAHNEFWSAPPRFKRPYEYALSVLRALNYEIEDPERFVRGMREALEAMGQIPFAWPAPNGYPDVSGYWIANLLPRWQFAIAAASGTLPGARANTDVIADLLEANNIPFEVEPVLAFMGAYLFGRSLTADEQQTVMQFARDTSDDINAALVAGIALLLAAPAFQYK